MQAAAISFVGPTRLPNSIRLAPVSFALVAVSSLVFLLFYELRFMVLLQWFNFVPLDMTDGGVRLGLPGTQWWRYVTPTLLHFGWLHLVFNCLWLWEFGQRIEHRIGAVNMLGLYLVTAVFSNGVQYLWSGPSIFGGMSGVVYSFLGFLWAASLVRPGWLQPPTPAILGFMLIWLVVGLFGTLEFLGVGAIANGAHVGGLVIGFILGGLFAALTGFRQKT